MSGSNSSGQGASVAGPADAQAASPLGLTVHTLDAPGPDAVRRTSMGRWKMLLVLAVCAAPVVASYFTYFVIRPQARTNYSELITPVREMPDTLPITAQDGSSVQPRSLHGQWLLVVVADAACNTRCEKNLVLARQLRETLGRDKDRVDKLWLVTDSGKPAPALLEATGVTALQVPAAALSQWLAPAAGQALGDHLYLVDPMGQWMMRAPVDPDPPKFKRDVERLLRAAASWDRAGR